MAAGRPVLVVDDADRENEADLVMPAQFADVDDIAFFLECTSGFLCVAMTADRVAALELPPMVDDPTDPLGTAFTVSVDAAVGVTTGISAADRARTIRALADREVGPADLTRPGHVMPLRARPGGVLERRGHTEAAVDLCAAAGLEPAGLICELVSPDRRAMLGGSISSETKATPRPQVAAWVMKQPASAVLPMAGRPPSTMSWPG